MLTKLTEWKDKASETVASWLGEESPIGMTKIPDRKSFGALFDCHFLSGVFPYETFDAESMLFVNKKSTGFMLEATTLLGSSEEVENILASIITDTLPDDIDMQFLLWASPKIGKILDGFEEVRSGHNVAAWLAKKRTEYLKKGTHQSLSGFGSFLIRDFRLFIVVSEKGKKHDAVGSLIGLRDDIESSLKSINIATRRLDAENFINTMTDIITPSKSLDENDSHWNDHDSLSLQITNPEWTLHVLPDSMLFSSEEESVEARCMTVREYPEYATQWKVTENIGQLFNATLQIPCPFLVSFSLQKLNQEKAIAKSQFSTMQRESTAKSQLAKLKPSVGAEYQEWNAIRTRLSEGDSLVKTFYSVVLFAQPEKANECERRLRDLYRANGWKLRKEAYLQFQTWLASMPMFMSEGMFQDLKYFGRLRTMTAFNAVNVAPLQGEWKGTRTPSLLLPGRRGQIASWNPFDNDGGNYNIAITAAPGKGKSVLVQEMIVATLGAKGQVQVIDQGHSQQKTCQLLGGQFIEFRPDRPVCLNPFTFVTDIDESIEMLKPMISSMARPITGATEEEMSYIEKAIKEVFEREGNTTSLKLVSKWLSEQPSDISKNLSHLLYSYTEGVYADIFEGECTIDFSNPFIVWELMGLKSKKELRKIVLQLIIYQTSQKMFQSNRDQIKSCIIDEAWDLFDDDNIAAAKFIEAGYRTARKFRGNFISIAHSISDFHKNPMSKAAFDCSDFKIILGQTSEAINKLKQEKLMDIDGFTERLLKSLKITKDFSECVIKSPDGLSVHRINLDPYSRILYSTKGEEFEAVNRLVEQGKPLIDAVEIVAREFGHV